MRTVIAVPRREGNRDRDLTWAWVRQWWRDRFPDWDLYEGHHTEGPFNRSAAINRAAGAAGDWDTMVIIDADVICDPPHVVEGVALAQETGRMVLPFDVRYDLNPLGSKLAMQGNTRSWKPYVNHTYTDMCSSVVIVARRLWDEVGGFDETFQGWGFEDNAFAAACETFAGDPLIKMPGELWHMYHATQTDGKRGTASHARNKARAGLYLAARGDREATRAIQRTTVASYEHRMTGIPKILHRVVPEITRPQAERWWKQFENLHPDWILMTHRDPLDPAEWPETAPYWDRCKNGAELADLVRLEALLRWGGVYVDQDMEPLRPLDSLLPLGAFAAWEDERAVPNAVLGAVPAHPAIRACLDLCIQRIDQPTWERGPGVTTAVLVGRSDVLILPPGSFYPYHYQQKERAGEDFRKTQPWAFAVHHWWGSWLAESPEVPEVREAARPVASLRRADGRRVRA